ncbi:hypothetical protein [Methanobacterium formicicum]|uniref:hypothetical protein n=1 Tax=Methanobacterium formicicum TaxID=2162 RepID=UPI0024122032|nr:hypothetical protein [Methanobacterium formicicum]MDG3546625.1 hypothetical protein [Methanobacterium formicicum]
MTNENINDIVKKFHETDVSIFPNFDEYNSTLERALWVLWVAKDNLNIPQMNSKQIAAVLIEVKEISINPTSISKAFSRAGNKIHTYSGKEKSSFGIMGEGKEYLRSKINKKITEVCYFEPGLKYTNKKILSEKVLSTLNGELKIVDPYCGKRTLDMLINTNKSKIKMLTNIKNLGRKQNGFIREYRDFITEYPNVEIKDYQGNIHDRYIISADSVVLIGYSLKDFGKKETFSVVLGNNEDIKKQLTNNFDLKWNSSNPLI